MNSLFRFATLRFAALGTLLSLSACAQGTTTSGVPVLGVEIVGRYPHDPRAFTEGLIYEDGALFESTGEYGQSELRKVELETGKPLQRRALDARLFGEGLTSLNGQLIQLTWTNRLGLVYDQASFAPRRIFSYLTEGWGLTHDGKQLIMSDGTAYLYFLDPQTYLPARRVRVTANGKPVDQLNELEFIGGEVYANVWKTDRIARIDPQTGRVTAWLDLSNIGKQVRDEAAKSNLSVDVLNGIAYDAGGKRLFVTGKYWPSVFEVKLAEPRDATAP